MPGTALLCQPGRSLVYGAIVTLKIGMDILADEHAHGRAAGPRRLFKTPGTAQQLLAGALNVPVSVMATAGEAAPGAWRFWRPTACAARLAKRWKPTSKTRCSRARAASPLDPDPADHEGFEAHTPLHAGAGGRSAPPYPI